MKVDITFLLFLRIKKNILFTRKANLKNKIALL